jgi:hypothetical protein
VGAGAGQDARLVRGSGLFLFMLNDGRASGPIAIRFWRLSDLEPARQGDRHQPAEHGIEARGEAGTQTAVQRPGAHLDKPRKRLGVALRYAAEVTVTGPAA